MNENTDWLPPEKVLGQMVMGHWASQSIRTMAVLGLADHLAAGPRTTDELARESGAHAPSLVASEMV
jgi:C-methyltransferase